MEENYYFDDYNQQVRVAIKLMEISLENNPLKFKEISKNLREANDGYIIDMFYPEMFIAQTIYHFYRNRILSMNDNNPDWDVKGWIEFYDTINSLESLDKCPANLNDYLLKKIETVYKHKYARYDSKMLRRMAEVVLKETNLEPKGGELDFFPVSTLNNSVKYSNTNKSEGCYIATACYGSYYSKEVLVFRHFRDTKLKKLFVGRLFIKIYYVVSPILVLFLGKCEPINRLNKKYLDKIYVYLTK